MKQQDLFHGFNEEVRDVIFSPELLEFARMKPADFTRNRKMPFTDLFIFMINLLRNTTKVALNRFFSIIKKVDMSMTQQSFSEARKKLKWEACRKLFDKTVEIYYRLQPNPIKWHGYRLMAIDGSKQQLPSDSVLREKYGTAGRGDSSVTAQGSSLFDVLNDMIIDAQLEPMSVDERTIAQKHIAHLRSLPSFDRELLLFDRGYASFELINTMISEEQPITFVFRLRTKFNINIDKLPIGDHSITLTNGTESCKVRVVKFKLDSGETETLITNLWDKDLSLEDLKNSIFCVGRSRRNIMSSNISWKSKTSQGAQNSPSYRTFISQRFSPT